ncbi:hypothetical protein NJB18091_29220 [Mycobacterium marinum]|nr:hypothetical protein NJB18091_29220 [Mycobacterium marinum]GJO30172.1 hypothetical protein NJB1507_37980 [Mycobacterium marinum]GJO58580.1 hypothetical protein NJB1604_52260 [Mycobacterium marinum]
MAQKTHLRVLTGFSGAGRRLLDLAMCLFLSVSYWSEILLVQKGGSSSPPNEPDAGALPHGSSPPAGLLACAGA